jgi:MFS superfamily sulfate permease-like transporter
MIPTASLAAVLIYVGVKLVKPSDVRKLARFGRYPVLIYFVSMLSIVFTNLLTGVLVGVGLSLVRLIYTLTHLEVKVEEQGNVVHVHLSGVGTFLAIPNLTRALDHVKPQVEVHLHSHGLRYIDHGCLEVIESWVERREQEGQEVHIEMEKLHLRYRTRVSQSVV